ncbi:coiled-coil domain-containing protein 28A isoform X2 [Tribolium castaneum]|uniref:Coiled-coil domain-containing protein 28A-like Protein n=1 Tax=Tribolium castaneum TaxID=7070 RepID=D6WNN1_TRICA|nr:PREDICTED: coiled-coil domain-containing protein 28A isoform X2 [Tribolium castaneum]EFA03758.1 Coiled-coil domain-containing protein 28A-like Protein [Tribolium castaneum]|eukprot:XP_969701.1 PREDICTED: coiled-coil domain-containing protein 28A isoform X2 [Tribolium castaneum]
MESRIETSELQQLVGSDVDGENDDSTAQDENINEVKVISPVRSTKMSSSGNTSHSSVTKLGARYNFGVAPNSKVSFVNEKRINRDISKTTTARPRNVHKDSNTNVQHHCFISEVPDVRHMEKALLGLLADFHSGKLRAFGSGCTMEQMTNIRQQQEKLAKLHFDLGAATVPSLNDENLLRSQNTMTQLIQRLEQLSVSIEGLHSNTNK